MVDVISRAETDRAQGGRGRVHLGEDVDAVLVLSTIRWRPGPALRCDGGDRGVLLCSAYPYIATLTCGGRTDPSGDSARARTEAFHAAHRAEPVGAPPCSEAATACSRSDLHAAHPVGIHSHSVSALMRRTLTGWTWTRAVRLVLTSWRWCMPAHGGGDPHHVSTRVATTPHGALGLTTDDLLAMYRPILTSRLLDEAALRQNRMGRAPFVVPAAGHEGCQVGTAWAMRTGTDIWLPYYRDLGVVLGAGMTPYEVFLGVFAKADDPSSGGRQMPAHWGSRRLGHHQRLLPDRHAGPARGRHRLRGEASGRGRRGRLLVRRRGDERGRLARGPELRRDPPAAGDLRLREQPVRDQRAAVQADGRGGRRRRAPRATASPASWSTGTTSSRATGP